MNKQDKEKAREISYHYLQQVDCFKKTKYDEDDILSTARDAAIEMAAWKEEQMVEILRNMKIEDDDIVDYSNEYQCTPDYGFSEKFIKRLKQAMEGE